MPQLANPNPQLTIPPYSNSHCKSSLLIYFIEIFYVVFSSNRPAKAGAGIWVKARLAIEESRQLSLFQRSIALQLLNADPRWMSAVSSGARIRWGELVCEEFSDHFHLGPNKPEPDQRIFLSRCVTAAAARRTRRKKSIFLGSFSGCGGGYGACPIWA